MLCSRIEPQRGSTRAQALAALEDDDKDQRTGGNLPPSYLGREIETNQTVCRSVRCVSQALHGITIHMRFTLTQKRLSTDITINDSVPSTIMSQPTQPNRPSPRIVASKSSGPPVQHPNTAASSPFDFLDSLPSPITLPSSVRSYLITYMVAMLNIDSV